MEDGAAIESPLEIAADTTITAVFEPITLPEPEAPQQEEPVPTQSEPEQPQP